MNRPPAGSLTGLDKDLDRADARLNEIAGEASSSDWKGAADAAAAYREVISTVALPADAPSNGSALQRLDKQLANLERLRASSRGPETGEVDRAIAALCLILGIPVPTLTPAPVTSPAPPPSNHDGSRETTESSATARDAGSGSQPGHSPSPSTLPNEGRSGNSGADTGPGGPGDSGVDYQGPGSMPTDNEAKTEGP